jgi:peptidoglycan/LPS O-acetylase OafA/YrhL
MNAGRSARAFGAVAGGIALFAVAFGTSLRVPTSRSDEAWFLRRVRRSRSSMLVAVLTFAIAGFAVAAPDLGPQHVTEAMPLLLALPCIAALSPIGTGLVRARQSVRLGGDDDARGTNPVTWSR